MYLQVGRQWNVILFVPFVHFLIVLFFRLINRFDILLPVFSDFAERMLTPVKEIAVVQLFGGIQKMEYMNRLLPIPFKVTRSCAALRAADLDWIIGQGYSLGGYILGKNHEKPTWNHEKP